MEHVLMEEYSNCQSCNLYSRDYCTGSSREAVGFWDWEWSYTESSEDREVREAEYKLVLEYIRDLISDPEWPLWKWITDELYFKTAEVEFLRAFSDWNRDRGREAIADRVLELQGEK
jgi:hypothetical protein